MANITQTAPGITQLPIQASDKPVVMTRRRRPLNGFRVFTYIFLSLAAIVYLAPFGFMLGKSLMNQFQAANTSDIVPSKVEFGTYELLSIKDVTLVKNYGDVLFDPKYRFGTYIWNTARLEVISVVGQTVIAVLAAYAFARMRFPGRDLLFGLFLLTVFVPSVILLVPNVILVTGISKAFAAINPSFKWTDNWPGLVIPFLANTFSIFLLRQSFKQLPEELWEAAHLDGASHLRFLWQIAVPISRPIVLTTILLSFIGIWSALQWPLLIAGDDWRPVAVALQQFRVDGGEQTHLLMAASVIALLPIMLLYFFTQRQFTAGIATTGLKG